MKYLPFEDFEIQTSLSSDEVFYRLRAAVDTKRKWVFFTNKPFWGEVKRGHFKIWRVTWWNRNFSPFVYGEICEATSGIRMKIKMRMPWFGFVFYGIILCWLWFQYFIVLANLLAQKIITRVWEIESPWMLLPPVILFAFAYLISVGTFFVEADKVKEFFMQLSNAKNEDVKYQEKIFGITERQIFRIFFILTFLVFVGWISYKLFFQYFYIPP
jgi:hypothetical protein